MKKMIARLKLDRAWAAVSSLPSAWLLLGLAIPAVIFLFWLLMAPFTNLLAGEEVRTLSGRERVQARDATRQLILQATGGAAALAALVFTARSYLLNRRGQQTQRFKDAGEQLGSDSVVTRIAGVYSLEHVMRESPEDHTTVVEVLCAFIREHAPPARLQTQEEDGQLDYPSTDVQAALTVVARRPDRPENDLVIDLSGLHLEGAQLSQARLARADLRKSYLLNADLSGADLSQANLSRAVLRVAELDGANLRKADITSASLCHVDAHHADFRNANLHGTDLTGAHLEGAHLDRANLLNATLVETHLDQASLKNSTLICANLKKAFLVNADLSRADLSSALVESAMFHRSTMQGTSFRGVEGVHLAHFDFVDASGVVGFTREGWDSVFTNSITRAPEVFDLG
ncbi:pentapeptide repeat-containing protein [Nocardiopsis sp. CC223A]|uniref:pentapeptide repeat-containing protein n=1 Tax=Nocardiopsis sp. CC223A TaxID=3044051 RepID=UPI00278C6EC4|nr:pentapeptide repeat-containing protein [Nocardiopsis sp. CC223A]